mgnify:FL=1
MLSQIVLIYYVESQCILRQLHFYTKLSLAMKKLILSALFLSLIFLSAFSQTQNEEKQIQDLIQNSFDDLFSSFQSEKLKDYYTDDFILLEQGEVWDIPTILNYFDRTKQNPNPPTRVNRFEFIETKIEGNRAWIAYHNFATISLNGETVREIRWLESATAVKTKDGWRLDMLHSTRVEKD